MASVKKIVLASSSPRRKDLLRQIGISFRVDPSRVPEHAPAGLPPNEWAETLAAAKAHDVARRHRHAIVIGSDTVVTVDGTVLGKPTDKNDAVRILKMLSGRDHAVITAVSVCDSETGRTITRSVGTTVRMKKMSGEEIAAYVESGEPLDKAGAYGIQGLGAAFIKGIEGDHFAVVGLPLSALVEILKEFGISIWQK